MSHLVDGSKGRLTLLAVLQPRTSQAIPAAPKTDAGEGVEADGTGGDALTGSQPWIKPDVDSRRRNAPVSGAGAVG